MLKQSLLSAHCQKSETKKKKKTRKKSKKFISPGLGLASPCSSSSQWKKEKARKKESFALTKILKKNHKWIFSIIDFSWSLYPTGVSYKWVYLSSMTIKRCWWLADLVSLLSSLYFLKHPYLPKEPHHLLLFTIISSCHSGYCVSFCCFSIGEVF